MDPARLGGDVRRRRRRRPLPHELCEGVRVRARTLRGRPRLRGGRGADPEAGLDTRLAAGATGGRAVRPPRPARGGGTGRPAPRGGARGRGRPRDAHLHLRHDRAAEGVHAHAPQSRHGCDVRAGAAPASGRHRAPLSAAGPQLRASRAPGGDAARRHDRLRGRRRARARGARDRAPDHSAGRAAGIREDPREHARGDRAGRRPAPPDRSLGDRRRRQSRPAAPGGGAHPVHARVAGADRRPARLLEGARTARRPAPGLHLRRGAALHRRDGVLPCARDPGDRGLRTDRDRKLGDGQRPRGLPHRHRGPRRREHSRSAWPTTARSSSAATRSSPATSRIPTRPPPSWARTGGSAPATWARSTTTAS